MSKSDYVHDHIAKKVKYENSDSKPIKYENSDNWRSTSQQ